VIQRDIQDAAYVAQQRIDSGESVVVGLNRYQADEPATIDTLTIDPTIEARQVDRVRRVRAARDQAAWRSALDAVTAAARGSDNLVPPIVRAVEAHATVGEISDAMRAVFGEHQEIGG
jgi:methylmalonyl-CoA mutase N-terminal domain/subunit